MFFRLSLHSFTNCSDTLNWMVYGDDLSACTSPGSSNTNIYHYACTFKVINCRGEIIEMFVYQVVGSSPGAVICDWKPGLFLACTKKKTPSYWILTAAILWNVNIFTRRIAVVLLPSSQMGLGVKCHQVQFSLEIQWLKAEKEATLDVVWSSPTLCSNVCLKEKAN